MNNNEKFDFFIKLDKEVQSKEIEDPKDSTKLKTVPLRANEKKLKYAYMSTLWPDIMLWLSSAKLIKSDNGKISAERTIEAIENEPMKAAIRIFGRERARAQMFNGTSKLNSRYCSLVPIFMSAHKEFNDVGYEDWDKTDPWIKYVVGLKLWEDISPWLKTVGLLAKVTRKQAMYNAKGEPLAATSYFNNQFIYGPSGDKLNAGNLMRFIHFQLWMANVENRNKYMILDTINWDNIPESLDAQIEEQKPSWNREQYKPKPTYNEMPF